MNLPLPESPLAALALLSLLLSGLPAVLFLANLPFYRHLPRPRRQDSAVDVPSPTQPSSPVLSVLIPARNEESAILPALRSVLSNPSSHLEVLVLDDHSTDRTAERVAGIAAIDPRVRLLSGQRLPADWCGKQHACWQLARAARGELLVFMDADVRLQPETLERVKQFFDHRPGIHLGSGVPRQITGTLLEKLLIPLIHFVLLGYLPMIAARLTRWSAFAAGCGQFFVARRTAYFASDGHRAIRASLHDGIQLPRSFRRQGFQTTVFDATDLAECRMYTSAAEVWKGLGKNATEGMAHPAAILPWSFLLFGGHVLPWILLAAALQLSPEPTTLTILGTTLGLSLLPRLASALIFRQSLLGAVLHPVGITALLLIQWEALARRWRGRPMEWRGRRYAHPVSVAANSQSSA